MKYLVVVTEVYMKPVVVEARNKMEARKKASRQKETSKLVFLRSYDDYHDLDCQEVTEGNLEALIKERLFS